MRRLSKRQRAEQKERRAIDVLKRFFDVEVIEE